MGVAVGYIVGGQTLGFFVDIDKVSPSEYVHFNLNYYVLFTVTPKKSTLYVEMSPILVVDTWFASDQISSKKCFFMITRIHFFSLIKEFSF